MTRNGRFSLVPIEEFHFTARCLSDVSLVGRFSWDAAKKFPEPNLSLRAFGAFWTTSREGKGGGGGWPAQSAKADGSGQERIFAVAFRGVEAGTTSAALN